MKEFFNSLFKEIKISIERFFTTFCLTVILFLVCGYMVIFEPDSNLLEIMLRIILTLSFGMFLCTFGKILLEKYSERIKDKKLLFEIGLIFLSALAYPMLKNYIDNQYVLAGYGGIMLALFLGIVYAANTGSISKSFSYILKNTVFNGIACLIVAAGTSLSIFAFYTLIYEFENSEKVYLINWMFIWIILFLNLSLSTIPRKNQELKIPNLFKVIVMYVALPVYLLLISILYVYLGKILITFRFPSGQINWFASFASLLFVFFILTLEQYKKEYKLARIFVNLGGYVMIPIIIMQFTAIYIRLSNYGLTTARYISLVLNIIALMFMIVSLIKEGRYVKNMLVIMAAASLFLTITPLNLFDVPLWEQSTRLTRVLNQNNMIVDGKIAADGGILKEDKIKITSAYDYIYYGHEEKVPDIFKSIDRKDFEQVFGFPQEYEREEQYVSPKKYGYYFYNYDFIDIEGYSRIYTISQGYYSGAMEEIKLNNSEKTIKNDVIIKELEALYSQDNVESQEVRMEFQMDNGKIVLTNADFEIDENNQLFITWINGYFLEKTD